MNPEAVAHEPSAERHGVAIVGMSCLFPGAPDLDSYWQNILNKVDAVTDPSPDAWDAALYYDPEFTDEDKVYCRRGGYLGSLASFDPLSNSIPPVSVGGEPDQWLALQLAQDALADAGWSDLPREVRHRTAVVLGKGTYLNAGNALAVQRAVVAGETLRLLKELHPEYTDDQIEMLRQAMKRALPPLGPETVPGLVPNVIVGRIANRLDLMGPTYTVDAACASSLVAVQLAMRNLLTGECDLALAGGSQVWMPVPVMNVFCRLGALSRSQQIRPFDKDADGTLLGEGIGLLVLKRVADAVRDGDRIYAVIRGVGVATDGRGVSVMAPRIEGEELALRRAYAETGVSPRSVGLIEAHGTGTPVGDVVELQSLRRVFGSRDGELPHCALGTVKSMISHTIPASGVAGLIKVALALYHQALPPTLHCREPNPKLELDKTPFYVNSETRPWIHGGSEPRRAGVNAFGFGGINAHAVVEEFRSRVGDRSSPRITVRTGERLLSHHAPVPDSEVCILEGESQPELVERTAQLARAVATWQAAGENGSQSGAVTLADVAYTLSSALGTGKKALRLAVVATSFADLKTKLDQSARKLANSDCRQIKTVSGTYFAAEPLAREGKLSLVFPGEGAQYVNMLADLCLHFPEVRETFDRSDRIYFDHPRGFVTSDIVFPRPAFSEAERQRAERRLLDMDSAIEAVLTANSALFALLLRLGIKADSCVGHSTGEYSAALAAGVLDLNSDERLKPFIHHMYQYYSDAIARDDVATAVLLAVGADRALVEAMMSEAGGDLHLALDNCPHQTVLAGERSAVDRLRRIADARGLVYEELPFNRAVHTSLFSPYTKNLVELFDDNLIRPGHTTLYSCATAEPYPTDPQQVRELFVEQWSRPVEFRRTIERLHADGTRLFLEVGPRGHLTAFIEDILRGSRFCAIPANVEHRSGVTQIHHLVGMLAAHGVDLDFARLYSRRSPKRVALDGADVAVRDGASGSRVALINAWPKLQLSKEVIAQVHNQANSAPSPWQDRDRLDEHPVQARDTPSPPPPPSSEIPQPPPMDMPEQTKNLPAAHAFALTPTADPPQHHGSDTGSAVMSAHFDVMHHFLSVHEQIMRSLLPEMSGLTTAPPTLRAPSALSPFPAPPTTLDAGRAFDVHSSSERLVVSASPSDLRASNGAHQPAPTQEQDWPDAAGPGGSPAPGDRERLDDGRVGADDRQTVAQRLLTLVSERTGYPIEMLDVNADLEADLGIDSIKRVEILGSYRQQFGDVNGIDFEELSRQGTLQRIVDLLAPASGDSSPVAAETPLEPNHPATADEEALPPLLGTVVSHTPGSELVTRRVFDLAHDRYLRDHSFGGVVSTTDSSLLGLAVMPLTMSLEVLAEAAARLVPQRKVTGLRDVRAYRWLMWDGDPQELEVTARRLPGDGDEDRVTVQLRNLTEDNEGEDVQKSPVIEAIVLLREVYPESPASPPFDLTSSRPSSWAESDLYTRGMFHGPLWQGVRTIERTAADGAVARLQVLPFERFLSATSQPRFVIDPVVLDAAGQVIGFWTAEHLTAGKVIFPFRLAAVDIYGSQRPHGEDVTCRAKIDVVSDHLICSEIAILDGQGQLWMKLHGWEDKRFDVPLQFATLLHSSESRMMSVAWPEPIADFPPHGHYQCRRISVTLPADRSFWKRVWAQRILTRVEREQFRGLRLPEHRQLEWLGARTAAKEAVQSLLKHVYGIEVLPADIEIYADHRGRPLVRGACVSLLDSAPTISLAHSQGCAVALVSLTPPEGVASESNRAMAPCRVGIDLEALQRRPNGFASLAFTADEEALLGAVPSNHVDEWMLRCWCAKEAVAKGLGFGLLDGPPSVRTIRLDPDSGRITVRVSGALAAEHPDLAHLNLQVFTRCDQGFVVATTLCEAELRGPGDTSSGAEEPRGNIPTVVAGEGVER